MNDGAMYLTAAVNGSGPMDQDDANGPAAELEGEEHAHGTSDTERGAAEELPPTPGQGITPINDDKRQTRLMRGRRRPSPEAKQKEEEGAPFGCSRPHFDQQTEEVEPALQLLSASPRRARATTRTSAPCGRTDPAAGTQQGYVRRLIIHVHVTTAILEEYLVLSRSTTIEVQQRLRERRLRIRTPRGLPQPLRAPVGGFWPEKQSPNGAVGTQSSSRSPRRILPAHEVRHDRRCTLPPHRYPHRFVDDLGEDGVASGDMDPLGQKECYHAILDSDHNQLVLGCVWTVDGDVT